MNVAKLKRSASVEELFAGITQAPALQVTDVSLDARAVAKGGLFLARRGTQRHGLQHADQALANGASAIAYETPTDIAPEAQADCVIFPVPNLSDSLATVAERFFDRPADALELTAITGTNGKTTVAWLLANALVETARKSAYLGTIGAGILPDLTEQSLTTPDIVEITRRLREFVDAGAHFATLEASSHALAQDRLQGLPIRTAIFTNLSHDHLDFHGSMEAYFAAKATLFARPELQHRIIVVDDPAGQALADRYPDATRVSLTARPGSARYVFASDIEAHATGYAANVETHLGSVTLSTVLVGRFNLENSLAAFAAMIAHGFTPTAAAARLAPLSAPTGRMQRVSAEGQATVVVDFAHTPAALESALKALRAHCRGRLWCVFGSGGDRDKAKRPLMARAAESAADELVITSDNPRSESPSQIIQDVLGGLENRENVTAIADRSEAIGFAIKSLQPEDCLLIAGKGHERYQDVNGIRLPFSDIDIANAELTT